jgi:AbrB family looped-hinge helix DNA binding protein
MRITSKGQVTIPIEIRLRAGLLPGAEVEFVVKRDTVILRRAKKASGRGARLVEALRGTARRGLTTDQIMALTRAE